MEGAFAFAVHTIDSSSEEEEEEDERTEKIRRIREMQQEIRAWHTFHSLGDDAAPADAARALAEYSATRLFASEPCAAREWYGERISSLDTTNALELREAMLAMFPAVATVGDAGLTRQWKTRWRSLQRQWPDIFFGDGTWMNEPAFGASRSMSDALDLLEERKSDEQVVALVNETEDEVEFTVKEDKEMTELQRAQYNAKVESQIARWYHADELRNTKGSKRVRDSARAMADLINAISGLPGGKELMQRLSIEIEDVEFAMKEVVSAYLVKAARVEEIERMLNVFQESTTKALTGLKGCTCRTGNCSGCTCSVKDVPMCNDNCGCGDKCLLTGGKKNGLVKQMEKKAKKAAKKLAEEEKERCKAIRDKRDKDEKRRAKQEAEQKLKEKEKKKAKAVKQTKHAKAESKKKPKKKSKKQESSDEEESEDDSDDSDESDDSEESEESEDDSEESEESEEEEKPKKKKGGKRH